MNQGLVQVYTGDGKGKTTAATGLLVRALGQGLRVLLVRFLKPELPVSGELLFLRDAPGLTVLSAGVGVFDPAVADETICASVRRTFAEACELLLAGDFELAVFDELNTALDRECLPPGEVLDLIRRRPPQLELVFTGRHAPDWLLDEADLVSRIEAVKHPYDRGIPARRGIDY